MRQPLPARLLFVLCAAALCAAGCGTPTVSVSGKLVLPPNVKLAESDSVGINFRPENPAHTASVGIFNAADQTFVANNLAPGKYKIGVQITPYAGQQGNDKRAAALAPLNQNFNISATKLTYDVTSESKQSITIDLAKGTVTKG